MCITLQEKKFVPALINATITRMAHEQSLGTFKQVCSFGSRKALDRQELPLVFQSWIITAFVTIISITPWRSSHRIFRFQRIPVSSLAPVSSSTQFQVSPQFPALLSFAVPFLISLLHPLQFIFQGLSYRWTLAEVRYCQLRSINNKWQPT
jgi:hypothetical protein